MLFKYKIINKNQHYFQSRSMIIRTVKEKGIKVLKEKIIQNKFTMSMILVMKRMEFVFLDYQVICFRIIQIQKLKNTV